MLLQRLEALEQKLGDRSGTRSELGDLEDTTPTQSEDEPGNTDNQAEIHQNSRCLPLMKRKHDTTSPEVAETATSEARRSHAGPANSVRFDPNTFTFDGGTSQSLMMDESPQLSIPHSASTVDAQPIGTLMIDKAGRSKYLGPTAGSDWLKDVGIYRHINANIPARICTKRLSGGLAYSLTRAPRTGSSGS